MTTHELLSPAQRELFSNLPELIDDTDLLKYYTFNSEELNIIRSKRGNDNRFGFAVQICYLRFPGRILHKNEIPPIYLKTYISEQLGIKEVQIYQRDNTRKEHLIEIQKIFGYKIFSQKYRTILSEWLLPVAMSNDTGITLVSELVNELRIRKIIIPAISTVEALAWEVRQNARDIIFSQLTEGLNEDQLGKLNNLILNKKEGVIEIIWLRQIIGKATPKNFLKLVDRINFIRSFNLNSELKNLVHKNRFVQLAKEGAKYNPSYLERFNLERRNATLVAFLLRFLQDLLDQAVDMNDKIIGSAFNKAKTIHDNEYKENSKIIKKTVRLYAVVGKNLIVSKETNKEPFESMESVISWNDFVSSVQKAEKLYKPVQEESLEYLQGRYATFREYTPKLIDTLEFKSNRKNSALIKTLEIIKELNKTSKRKVPEDAPLDFVKKKWEKYVINDDGQVNRNYYEMCFFSELKDELRSGDIHVVGSQKYKEFNKHLLPEKDDNLIAVETDFSKYISERKNLLDTRLKNFCKLVKKGKLKGISFKNNKISISRPDKLVPDEAKALTRRIYNLIPKVKITEILLEVDSWTNFTKYFTHLQKNSDYKEKEILLAGILADGTNMGLSRMAHSCPEMTLNQLLWVSDFYIREETYSKGIAEIVNFHHKIPFASYWGKGKTSSSDGQSYRLKARKSNSSDFNPKYGSFPTATFYTHISDQYSPFYSKVISSSLRDATHVLDGLLYHDSELEISEHYTDTAGYTYHVFALCHLLGFRFAPRIRGIERQSIFSINPATYYSEISFLIGEKINLKLIEDNWDEILKLASSIKKGTVTASFILHKLASYPKRNNLAKALDELGKIEKTLFMLDYFESPEFRKVIYNGLNKGEARNALAQAVFMYRLGELVSRSFEDQSNKASGLNLVTAAIALWNTVYISEAVNFLSKTEQISEELLPHISPLGWEHINLSGDFIWKTKRDFSVNNLKPLRTKR